ncbi:hypothetical protein BC830DRAFT_351388 [Chytriomyces sp. MP71]|nr:hypothetical protein BC830DRAFT_351388 [Chytriomyces sp. MP71]
MELERALTLPDASTGYSGLASCAACNLERNKSELLLERIQALELQNAGLLAECANWKSLADLGLGGDQNASTNVFGPSIAKDAVLVNVTSPWVGISPPAMNFTTLDQLLVDPSQWIDIPPLSASQLFGKPRVEKTRAKLNSIPSLKTCQTINRFLDLFEKQAYCTDLKTVNHTSVRILSYYHKVIDATHISEQHRAIEALTEFQEDNKEHIVSDTTSRFNVFLTGY